MEMVLALVAALLVYYAYQTMKNYLSENKEFRRPKSDGNTQEYYRATYTKEDMQQEKNAKFQDSEYGILMQILGALNKIDKNSNELEDKLIKLVIDEVLQNDKKVGKENSFEDYHKLYTQASQDDLEDNINKYSSLTKGEYKKRLRLIEFMFLVSYSDNNFSKQEEYAIIDSAAILKITNEDFNRLYDLFSEASKNTAETSDIKEAMGILKLNQNFSKEDLESAYNKKINSSFAGIIDYKDFDKPLLKDNNLAMFKIKSAYNTANNELKEAESKQ